MLMATISPGNIVTGAYYCAHIGNICPRLDLVIILGWIASVCLSGTEVCTGGCCSGAGFCIGYFYISYYCTGTADFSSVPWSFSLVVRP